MLGESSYYMLENGPSIACSAFRASQALISATRARTTSADQTERIKSMLGTNGSRPTALPRSKAKVGPSQLSYRSGWLFKNRR